MEPVTLLTDAASDDPGPQAVGWHHRGVSRPRGLIAVDLDGTLLTPERQPHPASAGALLAAQAAGFIVCLASGRAIGTMLPFQTEIGLRGPIVSCNGAYVVDEGRRVVHNVGLNDEVFRRLLDYAEAGGVHTNVYCRDELFFSGEGRWADLYRSRIPGLNAPTVGFAGLRALRPTKVLFIDDEPGIRAHGEAMRRSLTADEANITVSEAEYIEFLPPRTHKGDGVARLAAHLGIPRERVAAIGDYHNDREMLEWAGFSAAMATAPDEVKAVADVTVEPSTEGGVATFVNRLLSESSRL